MPELWLLCGLEQSATPNLSLLDRLFAEELPPHAEPSSGANICAVEKTPEAARGRPARPPPLSVTAAANNVLPPRRPKQVVSDTSIANFMSRVHTPARPKQQSSRPPSAASIRSVQSESCYSAYLQKLPRPLSAHKRVQEIRAAGSGFVGRFRNLAYQPM